MTKGLVIREDGTTEVKNFDPDTFLADLYTVIGADIVEAVTLKNGLTAWLDEEGKLKGRQRNGVATKLYEQQDILVGPVVVFGEMDDDGYDTDVPDAFILRMKTKTLRFAKDYSTMSFGIGSGQPPVSLTPASIYEGWVSDRDEVYVTGQYVGGLADFEEVTA